MNERKQKERNVNIQQQLRFPGLVAYFVESDDSDGFDAELVESLIEPDCLEIPETDLELSDAQSQWMTVHSLSRQKLEQISQLVLVVVAYYQLVFVTMLVMMMEFFVTFVSLRSLQGWLTIQYFGWTVTLVGMGVQLLCFQEECRL